MNLNFLAASPPPAATPTHNPAHPKKPTLLQPATGPQKTFSIKNSMIDIHQP